MICVICGARPDESCAHRLAASEKAPRQPPTPQVQRAPAEPALRRAERPRWLAGPWSGTESQRHLSIDEATELNATRRRNAARAGAGNLEAV